MCRPAEQVTAGLDVQYGDCLSPTLADFPLLPNGSSLGKGRGTSFGTALLPPCPVPCRSLRHHGCRASQFAPTLPHLRVQPEQRVLHRWLLKLPSRQ